MFNSEFRRLRGMSHLLIKKVAVIGSGVMGSQIAAHVTNAGVPVVLLDIAAKDGTDRAHIVREAVDRMRKAEPSPFMHPNNADLIVCGTIDDDLGLIKDADWIVEVVLENPDVKAELYRKIEAVRKRGSIVSSNTSTIPLKNLVKDQPKTFARDFMITHFFNPPRYMRLMECVIGENTDPQAAKDVSDFCDHALGKGVVVCKDEPGFVSNRLGLYFLQCGVNAAFELGLTVEEADAVFGKPMGMPRTGIFGLSDLIGLDLIPLIAKSFLSTLPPDDPYRAETVAHPVVDALIARGFTGRKGKGGYYRIVKTDAGKVTESVDLKTGAYRASKKAKPKSVIDADGDLRALCEATDNVGKYAWTVLSKTLAYAASLVGVIADDIGAIDAAMRWGFNWQFGPFELIDKLGAEWFAEKLKAEGRSVPAFLKEVASRRSFYRVEGGELEFFATDRKFKPVKRPEGVILLADVKRASRPVLENASASLWDVGDGVLCFEFHTKMNALDDDIFDLLKKTVVLIESSDGKDKGLVIYNEAEAFSAGADLGVALMALNASMHSMFEGTIRRGQEAFRALRFARFPTVAAPAGLALGGGCEITLHCSATQAYAETYMGLVEVGAGLIPSWGGCTRMLKRAFEKEADPMAAVRRVFETIGQAKQSKSAASARDLLYLRETDGITMNRDRLLADAKRRVLGLVENYSPPELQSLELPGSAGRAALEETIEAWRASGIASPHDATVLRSLASVLSGEGMGGLPASEDRILEAERCEFMKLQRMPKTIARIEHMLKTGKALKN